MEVVVFVWSNRQAWFTRFDDANNKYECVTCSLHELMLVLLTWHIGIAFGEIDISIITSESIVESLFENAVRKISTILFGILLVL